MEERRKERGIGVDKMDDEYLDYELALPEALRTISNQEKKELYEFKQSHSNLEWEEELVRRVDLIAKNIDMERLQRMMSTSSAAGASTKVEKGKSKKSKTQSKKRLNDDDDDEDDKMDVDEDEEDVEEVDEQSEGSGSDEDLFDSDEEEEITSRFKSKSKQKVGAGRKKGKQAKKKAADSDDDDDYMKKDIDFGSSDDDIEPRGTRITFLFKHLVSHSFLYSRL